MACYKRRNPAGWTRTSRLRDHFLLDNWSSDNCQYREADRRRPVPRSLGFGNDDRLVVESGVALEGFDRALQVNCAIAWRCCIRSRRL